jgi:hypothetical protein
MNAYRLWVDYNNIDIHDRVRLDCEGTLKDIERQQLAMQEGVPVTLWDDDADDQGHPLLVEVDGVLEFSPEDACWVAKVNWKGIRYLPIHKANTTNGTLASGTGHVKLPSATSGPL